MVTRGDEPNMIGISLVQPVAGTQVRSVVCGLEWILSAGSEVTSLWMDGGWMGGEESDAP